MYARTSRMWYMAYAMPHYGPRRWGIAMRCVALRCLLMGDPQSSQPEEID